MSRLLHPTGRGTEEEKEITWPILDTSHEGKKISFYLCSNWDLGICDALVVNMTTLKDTSKTLLEDMSMEVFLLKVGIWINRGKEELPLPNMDRDCSTAFGPGMPEHITCLWHQNCVFTAFRIPVLHQHHLNISCLETWMEPYGFFGSLSCGGTSHPLQLHELIPILRYLTCHKSVCPMDSVSIENYISRLLLQNNLTYSECYTPLQMKDNSI